MKISVLAGNRNVYPPEPPRQPYIPRYPPEPSRQPYIPRYPPEHFIQPYIPRYPPDPLPPIPDIKFHFLNRKTRYLCPNQINEFSFENFNSLILNKQSLTMRSSKRSKNSWEMIITSFMPCKTI